MRLYASVIKLLNLYPVTIPPPGGGHAHAAFLDIVRQVDPALSQALHDTHGKGARQPFTVSPIQGLPRVGQASACHLREGWECWLRVTMLDETLFRSFIEYFLERPSPRVPLPRGEGRIRLGDAHFAVTEILTTPGSHPWAGFTTLEDLQKRLDEPPPPSITFEFHSPTSFKLQGKEVELMPYPKLVFGNLAGAWRALTGEDLVEPVEKYAEANLRLVLHRLERRALTLKNYPQLGSVGRVEYQFLRPEDTPLARALNLLADLAFYTGIGRKTPQGMGMARRLVG
ncbi:MAG: CRISPR system precrRNA processing endoribonuclease RAMP protein Cas6 [Anaerolineales bacterium]